MIHENQTLVIAEPLSSVADDAETIKSGELVQNGLVR